MDDPIENEDNENEESNEADSESLESCSSEKDSYKMKEKKQSKKQSNWDTTTKVYKADFEFSSPQKKENKEYETIEKKAVEKSPRERFIRFDEVLGNGSFKRVYKAYDLDDAKEVAWNVINVGNMTDEEIKKIVEEINLIKKLKNPRILNYISGWVNESKKEVVFITDIFSGGSLKQYLTKIKYPRLKVIKHWCKEILKGLTYLHEQDNPIIHRDIKCDNIFIDKNDGKITIGDLGYSCVLKNDYANSFSGTPEFMAPEVFESKYGINADIYSFGMCLLEMITLEKPYKECENIWKIYTFATQGVLPKTLNRIHHEKIKNFIKSCLKKENERPTAKDLLNSEFLNDLEQDENNYPVPLLDEDCRHIINQENSNNDSSSVQGFYTSKFKSRESIIMEKNNKTSEFRATLKNSPNAFKKALHVKIEEKFDNCRTSHINDLKKQASSTSTVISPNDSNRNNVSPHEIFFSSSSDSEVVTQKKQIMSSNNNYNMNNTFVKRNKLIMSQNSLIRNGPNFKFSNESQVNLPFSKLELFLEKEPSPFSKNGKDNLVIILKIKKQVWKNKKKIKFNYNLKIDTVEKVVNEMKSQRQLNLNNEETLLIMEKLSNFLKSIKAHSFSHITLPVSLENPKNTIDQPVTNIKKKISTENFLNHYHKILNKAKKLINSVVDKDNHFSHGNNSEILEKISILQKFVFDKSNKKEHINVMKENQEKVENIKREIKFKSHSNI